MLYAIVALLVIILDQWTKFWVAGHIALNTGSRELIPGVIKLVNIHNDGAALGFLSGKNAGMLFIILCGVFTIFVIIALATKLVKSSVGRWSLLFIMAGGLSNCIDRLLSGYVQDMFMPTFLDKLPIFNVADIFITVFCLVFILFVLFGGRRDDDYDDEDEDDEEYEDEDEDEDEEEDEEAEKAPRGLGAMFGSRSRKRGEGEDDEDDEDEDEEEDEEDEEDEEEEEEKPHGLFARLRSRSRDEDEDEEEEEDEEEDEDEEEEDDLPPARRPSRYDRAARGGRSPEKHAARKVSRVEEEDEEEEEAPVVRRQRAEKKSAAPKRTSRRDRQAELDEKYARFKAERAAREQQWSAAAEEAPVVDPSDPFAEWDGAARKAEAAAPAAEPAPAPAPAPKAEEKDESMEFSLEDILAEFK